MERKSFRHNPDNLFDTEMRLKALEGAKVSHTEKTEDESRAGVPSHDESTVFDWIRNRIDIPEDMIKGPDVLKVEAVRQPEGDYEVDSSKLHALTREELQDLLTGTENISRRDRAQISKGPLLNGYAIDPETLQSLQTTRHGSTYIQLAKDIAANSGVTDQTTLENIQKRIISGLVYLQLRGFRTPIVKLNTPLMGLGEIVSELSPEVVRKIANHIKDQRKLLPISLDFHVL